MTAPVNRKNRNELLKKIGLFDRWKELRDEYKVRNAGMKPAEAAQRAWDDLRDEIEDKKAKLDDEGEEFEEFRVSPEMMNRVASIPEVIRWVARNIEADEPKDPPSADALCMWRWARRNKDDFWRSHYSKLIPSRTNLEVEVEEISRTETVQKLIESLIATRSKGAAA